VPGSIDHLRQPYQNGSLTQLNPATLEEVLIPSCRFEKEGNSPEKSFD
jgi:hypothetical protein